MNELLKTLLSLSLAGNLLILILLLFKFFFKEKISKKWQYYIWLVVIARFLFPFAPETNLVGTMFQGIDHIASQTDMALLPQQNNSTLSGLNLADSNIIANDKASVKSMEQVMPDTQSVQSMFIVLTQNIWLVWLMVAIALLIRKITIYQSFVNYMKASRIEVEEIELLERFGKLVEQAHVKRVVSFYTNTLISSPLLIGFFHPCVILPSTDIPASDFQYTILHELTHYKRMDMFYKWLVQIVICLHWFNPLVYIMGREINKACELSCDEAVICKLDEREKNAYGKTLLNAMSTGGHYENSLASVTLSESKTLLKERLNAIMNFKKKSRTVICGTALLTVLFLCSSTFIGAYAANTTNAVADTTPDISIGGTIKGKPLYIIYTEKGLRSLSTEDYDLDWNYMLANDIVLSSDEWVPIGTSDNPFTGYFDGNGCYIKGMTMTDPNANVAGLFGYAQGATLHNIELRDVDISSAGVNKPDRQSDPLCAVPVDTDLTDNRVSQKISANPDETATMETLDFKGKTYYLVFNEAQLRAIGSGEYGMDQDYMQQADIQMSTDEWIPIGTRDNPFTGSYQGNGYEIKGLTMTNPNAKIIGLFGFADGAHLHNITLRDYDISTAGKNVTGKSVAPILVFGMGSTRSYDNHVYPKE